MLILAVEQSTVESSAVLSDSLDLIDGVSWTESRLRSQQFFPNITSLLARNGKNIADIDVFAAGTGPGAFNALRMCISALRAFALPSEKKVFGVNSAQALALKLRNLHGGNRISIVGDARRSFLWVASVCFDKGSIPAGMELKLINPDQLHKSVQDAEIIATPDFDRIRIHLESMQLRAARLIEGSVYPHAEDVSVTAFESVSSGIPGTEFKPLYFHPPV